MIFPDFSSLFKIPWLFPDWKMPSHFSRFSSPSGNPAGLSPLLVVNFPCWNNIVLNLWWRQHCCWAAHAFQSHLHCLRGLAIKAWRSKTHSSVFITYLYCLEFFSHKKTNNFFVRTKILIDIFSLFNFVWGNKQDCFTAWNMDEILST